MQTVVVECVNLPPPPLCYLKYGKVGRARFDHVSMKQLGRGGRITPIDSSDCGSKLDQLLLVV